ncbi:MAG: branched-chain amino acid ABC transporter permease [Deltaproteobacteria bacterium]|nr:branched-chain amino acid ABC transporter permease [Deltaproteobacteria bacterium]RLA91184.1 MAG: branched-chain amino acid ABC transporter permease [Deltaproteobacteria bacterium]
MQIDLWLSAVIFGFSVSGILFLVSLGISIGFGLMRIVNMEQMLYYTFGAYMTYTMLTWTGNYWLGMVAAIVVAAFLGFIVETQLLRRVYGREMMFTMVVTFSVFLIGIGLVQYIWGLDPKPVPSPTQFMVPIFGVKMPIYRLLVISIALFVYILVQIFLNKTIIGKAIRAGIENPQNVQGLGINIYKIFTLTFVVASGLAGLGGALNAPLTMTGPYMGFDMLLFAFITVILGGLGSIKGTLVSALILGQVISIGGTIWSPLSFVAPFVVMFFVILIRPTGLYGVAGKAFGFE